MVHVLLVSGWQTVNIGDVAHTPGALAAFRRYAPDVQLTLWAHQIDDAVRRLLDRYFPEVSVIEEHLQPGQQPGPRLAAAFDQADLLVHGSGPNLVARSEVERWREHTAKPYGFFGITVDPLQPYTASLSRSATMINSIDGDLLTAADRVLLEGAAFIFCRDGLTRQFLQGQRLGVEPLRFGPDATVLFDFVDDDHGRAVLDEFDLQQGFLCAVPRLRFTPYYKLRRHQPTATDLRRAAYNAGYLQSDLAILRQGVISWVRATGEPALIVPEMSYAMELAEQELAGTFPDDVEDRVHILPRFWDLTEAAAVYRRAGAVLSMECHSPLIALAEGVPALYVRQPTDTIKGAMYHDLGLGDQLIEAGPTSAAQVEQRLTKIAEDRHAAVDLTLQARDFARNELQRMVHQSIAAAGTSQ